LIKLRPSWGRFCESVGQEDKEKVKQLPDGTMKKNTLHKRLDSGLAFIWARAWLPDLNGGLVQVLSHGLCRIITLIGWTCSQQRRCCGGTWHVTVGGGVGRWGQWSSCSFCWSLSGGGGYRLSSFWHAVCCVVGIVFLQSLAALSLGWRAALGQFNGPWCRFVQTAVAEVGLEHLWMACVMEEEGGGRWGRWGRQGRDGRLCPRSGSESIPKPLQNLESVADDHHPHILENGLIKAVPRFHLILLQNPCISQRIGKGKMLPQEERCGPVPGCVGTIGCCSCGRRWLLYFDGCCRTSSVRRLHSTWVSEKKFVLD